MAEQKRLFQTEEDAAELREISIQLDTYDDIFSDFDPRGYSQRELSEDFLKVIRNRYLEDKRGRFEVRFTIPAAERNGDKEALIKKRLRDHFAFFVRQESDAIRILRNRGYAYILLGTGVLLANTLVFFATEESNVVYQLLSILLVPAGWYGTFTGIGKVLDEPMELEGRMRLYEKFEKAAYIFISEELE